MTAPEKDPWTYPIQGMLLAALIVLMAVILALVSGARSSAIAEWVSALATVAAFIAAIAAARYAKGALGREEGRDERWLVEKEQEQARLISAWTSRDLMFEYPYTRGTPALTPSAISQVKIALSNASVAPVHGICLRLVVSSDPSWEHDPITFTVTEFMPLLPPTSEPDELWGEPDESVGLPPHPSTSDIVLLWAFSLDFYFRDNSGQWWRRDPDGALTKAAGRPAWGALE